MSFRVSKHQTIAEKLEGGLKALGHQFDQQKSWGSRYQWYLTKPLRRDAKTHKPLYYFVGPAGALRCGTSPSKSFAVSDAIRQKFLDASPQSPTKLATLQSALEGDL